MNETKLCCQIHPFPACCGKLCKDCWITSVLRTGKWNVVSKPWEVGIEFICPICKKVSFISDLL